MTSPDRVRLDQQRQQARNNGEGLSSWPAQQHQKSSVMEANPHRTTADGTVGEMLRQTGASTTPPPPGFLPDNQQQQQQQQQAYQSSSQKQLTAVGAGTSNPTNNTTALLSAELEHLSGGHRTSSFVNLAAVLGTGLAESMDDAAKGLVRVSHPDQYDHDGTTASQQQQPPPNPNAATSTTIPRTMASSASSSGNDHLSLARQSRHAAARLIGATPPSRSMENALGLDVAFFGGAAPPATLGGYATAASGFGGSTIPSSSASHQGISSATGNALGGNYDRQSATETGNYNNNTDFHTNNANHPSVSQDGYLSAAFSGPGAHSEAEDMFGNNINNTNNKYSINARGGRDVGLTVMEPGSANNNDNSNSVLGNLVMQEQQQQRQRQQEVFCDDPHCQDQPQTTYQYMQQQQQQQQQHLPPQTNSRLPDRDSNTSTLEVERGMQKLWVDNSGSVGQRGSRQQQQQQSETLYLDTQSVGGNSSHLSVGSQQQQHQTSPRPVTEADIRSFIWDTRQSAQPTPSWDQYQRQQRQLEAKPVEPSRCLVILRANHLQIPEVRSTCEAFGVVDSFRSDFAERGIIFVSYYDMRSAQYAALELEGMLRRRDATSGNANRGGGGNNDISVYYCVPLDSSTQTDESRLILADIPAYVDENSLLPLLSSYGAVRSLSRQGGHYGGASYEAEFHNVQDAKQALLELSGTQPWGPDMVVEVAMRQPIDRKRGRELLAIISRWRQQGRTNNNSPSSTSTGARRFDPPPRLDHRAPAFRGAESFNSSSPAITAAAEPQMVLGPDGRYSYMVVNNDNQQARYGGGTPSSDYGAPHRRYQQPQDLRDSPRQQVVHGPNGEIYLTQLVPASHYSPSHTGGRRSGPPSLEYYPPSSQQQYSQQNLHPSHYANTSYNVDGRDRLERVSGPYYAHQAGLPRQDHHGPRSHHPHSSNASNASVGGDDKDNKNLVLDLDGVENARDTRTSLMVRNIPNKYTQQMLLAEFTENGLGPGTIDFFYLPIDFKNRCNRGYAFINFVDFKDILPFHRRYFGKHWSTFNSDKICDITYARIQGKAAMLKRFENSALMEKDEEYKPLVFVSHGPEKGTRIPFPEAAAAVK